MSNVVCTGIHRTCRSCQERISTLRLIINSWLSEHKIQILLHELPNGNRYHITANGHLVLNGQGARRRSERLWSRKRQKGLWFRTRSDWFIRSAPATMATASRLKDEGTEHYTPTDEGSCPTIHGWLTETSLCRRQIPTFTNPTRCTKTNASPGNPQDNTQSSYIETLSHMSWNIREWTSNNTIIREQFIYKLNPDIMHISETHLAGENTIKIKNYTFYPHNRKIIHKNAAKVELGHLLETPCLTFIIL